MLIIKRWYKTEVLFYHVINFCALHYIIKNLAATVSHNSPPLVFHRAFLCSKVISETAGFGTWTAGAGVAGAATGFGSCFTGWGTTRGAAFYKKHKLKSPFSGYFCLLPVVQWPLTVHFADVLVAPNLKYDFNYIFVYQDYVTI